MIQKTNRLVKSKLKQFRTRIIGSRIRSCLHLSDQKFLSLFSLAKVTDLVADGNMPEAKTELLKYYHRKTSLNWLKPPTTITDLRLNTDRMSTEEILNKANEYLELKFTPDGSLPKIGLDGTIDWDYNPVSSREWILRLHRHQWWIIFGLAYTKSKDERYTRAFVSQMLSWVSNNPLPSYKNERSHAWRLMETGLRLRVSWIPCFALFFDSANFTDNAKLTMLRSIYDHAKFLSLFKTKQNHLLRESNGLACAGIYFSEFKEAKSWKETALLRFDEELKKQINQDGSQIEMSIGYQWLVVDEFESIYELIQKNGLKLPQENLSAWLEKMYILLAYVIRPDGSFPEINDGFIRWGRERLTQAGQTFNRDDLLYIGTDGKQGTLPKTCSINFSDAGFYVMRSDWTREARYLFFDAGPYGGHHGHEDKLSIEVFAYGQSFIVDSGSYTYEKTDPYRAYFVGSQSHNTVLVDGLSQVRRWQKKHLSPETGSKEEAIWISQSDFDYASSSYREGYGLFRLKKQDDLKIIKGVTHSRRIIFVKPDYWIIVDNLEADKNHNYQVLFHVPPEVKTETDSKLTVRLSTTSANACLYIVPAEPDELKLNLVSGSEKPIQGWFSQDHHYKVPSTAIIYEKREISSTVFTTLLYPVADCTLKQEISIRPLSITGNHNLAYAVTTSRGIDYLMFSENFANKQFGSFESAGIMAVFRTDNNGKLLSNFEAMQGDG